MSAAIRVEGLAKVFKKGGDRAVDGISLEVEKGSIFGFLGPNGAGKTTTINILCTLLRPTEGRAFVAGYDCMKEPASVRKSIGLVFQDTTLDKDLTAYENLVFHAYLYSVKKSEIRSRVEDALEFVGLYERRDEIVKHYSGGMKRRLEVARGLIHRPEVLFLDEPTLGLDPQSRANLWDFIIRLPEMHGVTVFMTTHYMDEAEVCDRIAIIDAGRIIAEGSPSELKKTVGGDVIHLRTTDNELATWKLRETLSLEAKDQEGSLYITTRGGDKMIPDIIRTLEDIVVTVSLERPSINDVFLKLTGKDIREAGATRRDEIPAGIRSARRRKDSRG
jgi:ABC-2 type transport system ATP-binding protein